MERRGQLPDFEQVVLPHLDAAYNLARWLVRDPPMAEDVVQDAVVRALKYFASFRGGFDRAWLLRIVRNTAYDSIKAQRQAMEVSLDDGTPGHEEGCIHVELPDPGPGPEAMLAQRQAIASLDKALDALPAALRECLILREVEMLSYKQIAEITGVPVGTVMSRLSRARAALKRGAVGDICGLVPSRTEQTAAAD